MDTAFRKIIREMLFDAQSEIEDLVTLSDSLSSIMLCKGHVHDLGLKVSFNYGTKAS